VLVLPGWRGSPARLAEVVLWLSAAIVISEVLGAAHVFYRIPELVGSALAAVALLLAHRRMRPLPRPRQLETRSLGRLSAVVVLGTIATVVGDWVVRVRGTLMHGMSNVDTLWYHMPFAARFVQNGSIDAISLNQPDPVTPFFPANIELVHAVGILLLGHDTLSPLLNIGWLALALLAGWVIGRPFGAQAATLVAVAIVGGTFIMTWSQAGEATNDMAALALFLAAIALIVNAGSDDRPLMIAALPVGLALGAKVSLIAPVAVLLIGAVASVRSGLRRRVALSWLAAMLLLGGYWYVRNLVATGSPLPWVKLGVAGVSLPVVHASAAVQSPATGFDSTLAHLVAQGGSGAVIRSGFRYDLGPAWWAVLALAAIGLLMSLVGRPGRVRRMLGLTGLIASVLYVFTPQTANFVFNVRYLTPSLTLGLVLVPMLPSARSALARRAVLAVLVALFITTQLDGSLRPQSGTWVIAVAVAAGVLGVVAILRRRPRLVAAAVVGSVGAAAIAGFYVQRQYLRDRYAYRNAAATVALGPQGSLWSVFAWARGVHHATIGLSGTQLQYPFFGLDLSNRVRYLEQSRDHGRIVSLISSCASWIRALDAVKPRYVITTPVRFPFNSTTGEPPAAAWTRSLPGIAQVAESAGQVFAFRVDRHPSAGDCRRAA
jgi:hypothetical protein